MFTIKAVRKLGTKGRRTLGLPIDPCARHLILPDPQPEHELPARSQPRSTRGKPELPSVDTSGRASLTKSEPLTATRGAA